ncbi:unnamed protein product [marine sediment metagenome]|uniref:Uncharacterized protein n=1 Tax=marine sediment metagenome TaxID=412755 RepID=X1R980_9ZZZZ
MDEKVAERIKNNKGILRQLTALNNEVKELKSRVKALEKRDSCYLTEEELLREKVGGTDPD